MSIVVVVGARTLTGGILGRFCVATFSLVFWTTEYAVYSTVLYLAAQRVSRFPVDPQNSLFVLG